MKCTYLKRIIVLFSYITSIANKLGNLGFEVITAVVMRSTIFWDTTPFSPLKVKLGLHAGIVLGLFYSEDGSDIFLRNVG
jgi:hypothetical protein